MVATYVKDDENMYASTSSVWAQMCSQQTNKVFCQQQQKPDKMSIICCLLPICCTLTAPLHVLQSQDCLRSGPPDVGELIVVAMPNGRFVNASFVRSHTHIYYQVRHAPASFMVE